MFLAVSQALWFLVRPSSFLALLLAVGTVLLWLGWTRVGRWATTIAVAALVTLVLLPVGWWLLLPLENRFPTPGEPLDAVDGVVVLGGAEVPMVSAARGQPSYNEAAERITALIELGRRYPAARLVFTGGGEPVTGAATARDFYRRQGFDIDRILFEDAAVNTAQNAVFTQRLARPQPGERWLLVTSARHMPRAVGAFRRAGWPVTAYPVDYRTTGEIVLAPGFDIPGRLNELDLAVKEWLGLIVYRLTGRTYALFPAEG